MTAAAPHYPLQHIQELIGTRHYRVTGEALRGAGELGFDEDDVVECALGIIATDFHKTMPAEKRPGTWQDVYRPTHVGIPLYVKLQIVGERPEELAVIIQFKRR